MFKYSDLLIFLTNRFTRVADEKLILNPAYAGAQKQSAY
jgi:hypothetical protein